MESVFNWPVLGHKNIIHYLQASFQNNKLHHAYLFEGPEHVGKSTLAQYFLNSLICELTVKKNPGKIPCNICQSCKHFQSHTYPDYFQVKRNKQEKDFKKNISIQQIMDLQSFISRHTFLKSYKLAIIEDAELLSESASNALLKILEEPTSLTIIILLIKHSSSILKTLYSRCYHIKFYNVKSDIIYKYLIDNQCARDQARLYTALSWGYPGIALNFFQDNESFKKYQDASLDFISLLQKKIHERLLYLSSLYNQKYNYNEMVTYTLHVVQIWLNILRDMITVHICGYDYLRHVYLRNSLNYIFSHYDINKLKNIFYKVLKIKELLMYNVNPKLLLEELMITL